VAIRQPALTTATGSPFYCDRRTTPCPPLLATRPPLPGGLHFKLMTVDVTGRTAVRLPPWMWGNDLLGWPARAELNLHPIDASSHRWEVETLERHERRFSPRLLELEFIAGRGRVEAWDVLNRLPATPASPALPAPAVVAESNRILRERPGDAMALLAAVQVVTALAPDDQFLSSVQQSYEVLAQMSASDGSPVLKDRAVWFVRVSPALALRAQLARVLMRIEEEPSLLTTKPSTASTRLLTTPPKGSPRATNVSVGGLEEAGIFACAGRVRLLPRDKLPANWDPATDKRVTVWEVAQHLVKAIDKEGEAKAADLLRKVGGLGYAARDLAYRLYSISERRGWAEDALGYNLLVTSWPRVAALATGPPPPDQPGLGL
jgi:hypothetical protein